MTSGSKFQQGIHFVLVNELWSRLQFERYLAFLKEWRVANSDWWSSGVLWRHLDLTTKDQVHYPNVRADFTVRSPWLVDAVVVVSAKAQALPPNASLFSSMMTLLQRFPGMHGCSCSAHVTESRGFDASHIRGGAVAHG